LLTTVWLLLSISIAQKLRKSKEAYTSCVVSGIIDNLSELFPATSSGTQWVGVTDTIRGGVSSGSLTREAFEGRPANVLRATVRQQEDGGFVQMTADLSLDPSVNNGAVDASTFDGLEINLMYGEGIDETGSFHVQ
jgi:hypothetical protein